MDLLSHDRLIGRHRAQEDYRPSPQDTLQFSYESGRYTKFARELLHETDVLKKKTLAQMIEDFSLYLPSDIDAKILICAFALPTCFLSCCTISRTAILQFGKWQPPL